ncbi:MAG TPA: MauE/DoxX family redox-associated membrane protein [Ktedonobacterales bacterium]|jgi:uncharacterized membrane protein YphA (DoxX/SURF4 family)
MPSNTSDRAVTATDEAASATAGWRARLAPAWALLRGPYPTLVSRAVVGGIFLLTGILKALDVAGFERSIQAYQMVPGGLVPIMANGLPWLEIVVGAYVLAGLYRRWSALAAGALLVIFIIAMGQALVRGLTLQCGCFGTALGGAALREEVNLGSILRDGVWLLLAAHLAFVPGIWTADDWLARRGGRGDGGGRGDVGASGGRPAHEERPGD